MLVGFAGEHDEGLRRVFDIQIARIGTEHLACCAADDHHVRPGLDPMLVRVPFDLVPMDVAVFFRQKFREPSRIGANLRCSAEGYSLVGVDGTS